MFWGKMRNEVEKKTKFPSDRQKARETHLSFLCLIKSAESNVNCKAGSNFDPAFGIKLDTWIQVKKKAKNKKQKKIVKEDTIKWHSVFVVYAINQRNRKT